MYVFLFLFLSIKLTKLRIILIITTTLISLLTLTKCTREHKHSVYIPPQTSVIDKQFNFHIVDKGVWRSSQPNLESIIRMKKFGLKTIINLRGDSANNVWEKGIADSLNLYYFNFPLDSRKKQNPEKIRQILKIVMSDSNHPVLIHCLGGKDRTGMIVGIYELVKMKKSLDEIHKEMLMYGYNEKDFPLVYQTVKNWDTNKE